MKQKVINHNNTQNFSSEHVNGVWDWSRSSEPLNVISIGGEHKDEQLEVGVSVKFYLNLKRFARQVTTISNKKHALEQLPPKGIQFGCPLFLRLQTEIISLLISRIIYLLNPT